MFILLPPPLRLFGLHMSVSINICSPKTLPSNTLGLLVHLWNSSCSSGSHTLLVYSSPSYLCNLACVLQTYSTQVTLHPTREFASLMVPSLERTTFSPVILDLIPIFGSRHKFRYFQFCNTDSTQRDHTANVTTPGRPHTSNSPRCH